MRMLRGMLAAAAIVLPAVLPTTSTAQEVIKLTVASSHPTVVPWVGFIKTHFMARTDEILAKSGKYKRRRRHPPASRSRRRRP